MKVVLCARSGCGSSGNNYHSRKRKNSEIPLFSTRTLSSSCLYVLVIVLLISKSSLAKDFYYHPDNIHHYSTSSSNESQHESNAMMEFVSTSTTARSNEAPSGGSSGIRASDDDGSDSVASTTTEAIKNSEATSRTQEIVTEEKQQEKAQQPFSTRVACNENEMVVDVLSSSSHLITEAYLQGLKNYPDPSCTPISKGANKGHHMQFRLSLSDLTFYRCGTNLIINKITGTRTYYNRLDVVVLEKPEVVEEPVHVNNVTSSLDDSIVTDDENYVYNTQTVLIKCQFANLTAFNHNNRIRRDVLPAGFQEADVLRVDGIKEGRAPDPMLTMRVRQDGRVIGHELLVQPGTPLTMEVAIDDQASREIYGILMSQMDVTDNAAQDEIIMLNGCSVDPYLFENFKTTNSDLLTAQFKAFKFPDSNYVLFRGTVNVCLDSCEPTDCSNGQRGYGRRRRRDLQSQEQADRLYEVRMTTMIRLKDDDNQMDPYILGGRSPSSLHNHQYHHHQLSSGSNNNAMFSLLRKAREQGANQVDFVATAANKAVSVSQAPPYTVLLFLSVVTSSILATTTTLLLVRS